MESGKAALYTHMLKRTFNIFLLAAEIINEKAWSLHLSS